MSGDKILGGFEDLLHRMQTGQPIPVTEISRVTAPNGQVMTISESKEITFGKEQDGEGSQSTQEEDREAEEES